MTEEGFNEEFILIMFLLVILYSSMDLQESPQYEKDVSTKSIIFVQGTNQPFMEMVMVS